jgi:hypothetical protein
MLYMFRPHWPSSRVQVRLTSLVRSCATIKQLFRYNSVALSPQANYTDWATATCRRNLVSASADRGVSRGQRGGSPTVVKLFR